MIIIVLILITIFLGVKDYLSIRKATKNERVNSQMRIERRNEYFRKLKEIQHKKYD